MILLDEVRPHENEFMELITETFFDLYPKNVSGCEIPDIRRDLREFMELITDTNYEVGEFSL